MTSSNTHDPAGAGSSDDLRGLEILLVEDSWVVGEAMKGLLELLGADVVGPATTTAEAERLLSEHAPDVALVDFHLRGGELSSSLIARLHEQGVPVIMISGSSESLSGLPVEAATILEKPVSEAQLLASLRPLLKSSEVFCNPAKGAPITWENLSRPPLLRHIGVTRPVWPGSVQGPFFPLWLPPPCFQKSRASILPTPNDRHDRFPTARASQDSPRLFTTNE